jgi:hypothetical protein
MYGMKKLFLNSTILLLALLVNTQVVIHAQVTSGKDRSVNKYSDGILKNNKKSNKKIKNRSISSNTGSTLNSTSEHKAYAQPSVNYTNYQIQDPILKVLNQRANGSDVKIGSSGIIGEPKGTYGFADGHIIFYSTGSTSSGTITGSGSVGTGSSPGSVGSNSSLMGVNGKSPYAGPSSWGTAVTGRGINLRDSTIRQPFSKKNK